MAGADAGDQVVTRRLADRVGAVRAGEGGAPLDQAVDAGEQLEAVSVVLAEPDAGIGLGFESPDGVDPVSSDADLFYRVR